MGRMLLMVGHETKCFAERFIDESRVCGETPEAIRGKRLRGGVEHSIGVERVNDADAISEPDQNRLGISLGEVEREQVHSMASEERLQGWPARALAWFAGYLHRHDSTVAD